MPRFALHWKSSWTCWFSVKNRFLGTHPFEGNAGDFFSLNFLERQQLACRLSHGSTLSQGGNALALALPKSWRVPRSSHSSRPRPQSDGCTFSLQPRVPSLVSLLVACISMYLSGVFVYVACFATMRGDLGGLWKMQHFAACSLVGGFFPSSPRLKTPPKPKFVPGLRTGHMRQQCCVLHLARPTSFKRFLISRIIEGWGGGEGEQ